MIPFYEYRHFDSCYLRGLKETLGSPEWLSVGHYSSNLLDNEIRICDATIDYRYHAALIAGVLGIRSLFVYQDEHPHYPNKMLHLADLFEYGDNTIPMSAFCPETFEECFPKLLTSGLVPKCDSTLLDRSRIWLDEQCNLISKELV